MNMKKILLVTLFALMMAFQAAPTSMAAGSDVTVTNENGVTFLSTETVPDDVNATPTPTVNPDLSFLPVGFSPDLTALLTSLLSVVIAVVALLVFFYLIWGGFSWITSGGDKGKTEQARGKILAAVVGLIIVAASYAILNILVRLLGYPSLTAVFEGIVPISGPNAASTPPMIGTTTPTPTVTPAPTAT